MIQDVFDTSMTTHIGQIKNLEFYIYMKTSCGYLDKTNGIIQTHGTLYFFELA